MMVRLILLAPALLALAACGQPDATSETPADTPIPVDPDGGIGDGAGPPEALAEAIPARFHGVWDAGDCSAASDMRLEVTADRLEYYESVGMLTAIEAASGGDVLARLAMKGEGQSWEDTVRLQLTEAEGREALLVLPGPDSDIELRPVPRFRCPA